MKGNVTLFMFLVYIASFAQIGMGTSTPNPSAQLDVSATNRGILIPRIALANSSDATTITSGNVESLLVYNTATTADVTPGFYYWTENKWMRVVSEADVSKYETVTTLKENSDGTYTYKNEDNAETTIVLSGESSWFGTDDNMPATENTEDVYHMGNISIGEDNLDPSAILQLNSSNKGLLLPKTTLTGENDNATIPNPATGLVVYNMAGNLDAGLYTNTGTSVNPVWSSLQVVNNVYGSQAYKLRYLGTTNMSRTLNVEDFLEFRMRFSPPYIRMDIRLHSPPSSNVEVKIARVGFVQGVVSGVNTSQTFSSSDWNTWKEVDYQLPGAGHLFYIQSTGFDKFYRVSTFSDNANFNSLIVESF